MKDWYYDTRLSGKMQEEIKKCYKSLLALTGEVAERLKANDC